MKLTFLGTGTSFGVPQVGCHCAVCRSPDPRDRRSRVGATVETDGGVRILIDTPPELRMQLISAGIDSVDAVLFTHEHADHTHGMDDLRAITVRRDAPLPLYGAPETLAALAKKFPYIFDWNTPPIPGTLKPQGQSRELTAGVAQVIGDVDVIPVQVPHGNVTCFGYRIGPLGYVTDAKTIPPEGLALLAGVKVLVLNALFRADHPTHLSISEAVRIAKLVGAERTFLTHLTHETLHADLEAELPRGVAPAFDGLTIRVD